MIKAISVGLYRDPTGIKNPRLIQKVFSKVIMTTSPFTNSAMLHLPLVLTNPDSKMLH